MIKPQAKKQLGTDGEWVIQCFPVRKLNGVIYYSSVSGFLDEQQAQKIVDLLNLPG